MLPGRGTETSGPVAPGPSQAPVLSRHVRTTGAEGRPQAVIAGRLHCPQRPPPRHPPTPLLDPRRRPTWSTEAEVSVKVAPPVREVRLRRPVPGAAEGATQPALVPSRPQCRGPSPVGRKTPGVESDPPRKVVWTGGSRRRRQGRHDADGDSVSSGSTQWGFDLEVPGAVVARLPDRTFTGVLSDDLPCFL